MKKNYDVLYEEVILHRFPIGPCEESEIVDTFQKDYDGGSFIFSDGTLVSGQLIKAVDEQGNVIPIAMSHADLEAAFFAG